jgi:molecular chaperone GrpE
MQAHEPAPDTEQAERQHDLEERYLVPSQPTQTTASAEVETRGELEAWKEKALRLQAEMENYRRRQRRLAQDQIDTEKERLLRAFLSVIDDLERALAGPAGNGQALHQGIQLTHRAAQQMMEREGVEPINAQDHPFDPNWHEAVATVGYNRESAAPGTVVQVIEPGYRLGDQLLRPAKVVVAV